MSKINIEINNCNNVDDGYIEIKKNQLNIKYGINGTGKSTISKGIYFKVTNQEELLNLKPFKYRKDEDKNPEVNISEEISSVLVFNEEYIENYVFKEDELLDNSFEILFYDEIYKKNIENINILTKKLVDYFSDNEDIDNLIEKLEVLGDTFGRSDKSLAKSSNFFKALSEGNKMKNVPDDLKEYEDFIRSDLNVKWAKWHLDGKEFPIINDYKNCPFCSESLNDKKESIVKVNKTYNHNNLNHLNNIINTVKEMEKYFNKESYKKLLEICDGESILSEEEDYILEVRQQIKGLISKLKTLRRIDYNILKNVESKDKLETLLEEFKINLTLRMHLNSEFNKEIVEGINEKINEISEKTGMLFGKINIQREYIKKIIEENKDEINSFLEAAGYQYNVIINEDEDGESYKLVLEHNDFEGKVIENATNHLSYGEKNAFALVLFMFQALRDNPDLIILDDPISSFDQHKKYAIIHMLFGSKDSLKGRTVLFLTHDFEPVIDTVGVLNKLYGDKSNSYFLENKNGNLIEKKIRKEDIQSFLKIAEENIERYNTDKTDTNFIISLIYLRRLFELENNKGLGYEVLSNLFKKRDVIIDNNDDELTKEYKERGEKEIRKNIVDFKYNEALEMLKDNDKIYSIFHDKDNSNYVKLQMYRIINPDNIENRVIRKFINETYHIENDYLYQLNPYEYDTIPNFIIDICKKDLNKDISN